MTALAAAGHSYALLADGTTIGIRPASVHDTDAVLRFYQAMSPDNLYLRFFSMSKRAAEQETERVCRPPDASHASLLAILDTEVVGVASYEPTASPGVAEVAFAVADYMHGRGIATLLLEHLVSLGRARQVQAFTAETLPENSAMLRVFTDAGLGVRRRLVDAVIELTMPLPRAPALGEASTYADAVAHRESLSDVESLRPLLHPESVVVVGASRQQSTVGRSILRNIVTGGYAGRVYAVNPHARQLDGIRCFPAVTALPEAPDLAVVAVPAASVPSVAEECGQHGVRAIVVITSALDPAQGAELLDACRRHSMRLVGPNCFGISVPGIGLNATFAAAQPAVGAAGLVMQSGGLGFALLNHLSRIGVGVSSFASVGNKFDVSGNDMLTWWEQDGVTRLAVLYLESFGNPRKFARTARRLGLSMPVLTVYAGRTEEGQRAAASHTAAVATPLISREALFHQAGIIATPTFGELLDTAALLASQPAPAGSRVALVSNVGGGGVLAADACVECGLTVQQPSAAVQRDLGKIIPAGGSLTGPVDTTAAIPPEDFRRCLEIVAADEGVDAMLAIILPTATNDLLPAVCAAHVGVPFAAVMLDQAEGVRLVPRTHGTRVAPAPDDGAAGEGERTLPAAGPQPEPTTGGQAQPAAGQPPAAAGQSQAGGQPPAAGEQPQAGGQPPTAGGQPPPAAGGQPPPAAGMVPAYAYPESAARALGQAARYGSWRAEPPGSVPGIPGLRRDDARALVAGFLTRLPGGGWLPPLEVSALLGCYGIPLAATRLAGDADEAVALAAELGGHVALKADVPGMLHKSDAGAVALDLRTSADVREAFQRFAEQFNGRLSGVLVQPMVTGQVEVIIGVVQDPVFGPVVVFGLGGVATEVLGDHSARLAPLTGADAADLIHSVRAAPLLLGHRGSPAVDVAGLKDALLRVSQLADDLPQVAELDLNPVIARPEGILAVDARIRVTSRESPDPFLRQLR